MERKSYSVYYSDGNRVVQGDLVRVIKGKYDGYEGMVKQYSKGKVRVELHDSFGKTFDYELKPTSFILVKRKHFDFLEQPPKLSIEDYWGIKEGSPGPGDIKFSVYELMYDSYLGRTVLNFVGTYRDYVDAMKTASWFPRWAVYEIDYFNKKHRLVAFKEMNVGQRTEKGPWNQGVAPRQKS